MHAKQQPEMGSITQIYETSKFGLSNQTKIAYLDKQACSRWRIIWRCEETSPAFQAIQRTNSANCLKVRLQSGRRFEAARKPLSDRLQRQWYIARRKATVL